MEARQSFESRTEEMQENLSGVGSRIAVMSGKGGAGKTTVAVNLAAWLARKSSVGLFDADVDCPNINAFLGIREGFSFKNGRIEPHKRFGMKVVSPASLQKNSTEPVIWRGPMLSNAIIELLGKADWGRLDYLIIDLPPGTSDVPLTVMQMARPDGIVIVTTPQEVSVTDAEKAANMARELGIPVLGIIENMSGTVFGEGGGERAAKELGVDFLGRLSLDGRISGSCERGKPFVLKDSGLSEEFGKIAEKVDSLKDPGKRTGNP
jgi:ATP-binding protein involved in chromosome partitioning